METKQQQLCCVSEIREHICILDKDSVHVDMHILSPFTCGLGKVYVFESVDITESTCACPLWFCACFACTRVLFIVAAVQDVTLWSVISSLITCLQCGH